MAAKNSKADVIIPISDRGQITIPAALRKKIQSRFVTITFEDDSLVMKPVQTREEFLQELDDRYDDWKKNGGGITLAEMKKKHGL